VGEDALLAAVAVLFAGSLVASAASVRWIRAWAERHAILDVPNARSAHTHPVPRAGGLAIAVIAPVGLAIACVGAAVPIPAGYVLAAVVVAGAGFADDVRSVPAMARLGIYALAAALLVLVVGGFTQLGADGWVVSLGSVGAAVAFLWVLGLTNAYNFMDGIDGLAGAQAVVAGAAWLCVGVARSDLPVAALAASLAGAAAGFLYYNWAPARIFMGDVGSAMLGFSFAALPLLLDDGASGTVPLFGYLVVWPFVLDAGFTFLRRLARRENVLTAHRTHLYQRLVIAGWSHAGVTVLYAVLAVTGAAIGFALVAGMDWALPAALLVPPGLFVALYAGVRRLEGERRTRGHG
jgi:UDP-N-acetylmuramyl pentapeptide phosphotransferase/UDP-N-acetylglucosamine-1-phosphate transferase